MISIIIPCLNAHEFTEICISSIMENTVESYEIILIDNGSDPPYSKEILRSHGNIIRNEANLGFPKAVNQGILKSKGEIIVVLNDDLVLTPSWLEILQSHLSKGLDMVGPVTNSISGPQQVLIDQYEDLTTLYKAAEGLQEKKKGQSYPYHRLVFFCVAIKREVIDKIGLLDEIYTPGNCEDDDFCMRAIEAGFKLGIAKDCYVHHFRSVTHKAMDLDYGELLATNQKIFNEKWGDKYKKLIEKNNVRRRSNKKVRLKARTKKEVIIKNIHLVMPFTRFNLLDTLIERYEPMDIIFHPIIFKRQIVKSVFDKPWIDPVIIPDNLFDDRLVIAYFKVNYFIKQHKFIDEDYYCFSCDDDMIEDEVYDAIKQMDDDIVIISMKRGNRIPIKAICKHGTNTLYADPSNIQINSISAQQSFVKGRIFKKHLFNESFSGADGEMAVHYKESGEQIRYEPNLFQLFNYYEPGRW